MKQIPATSAVSCFPATTDHASPQSLTPGTMLERMQQMAPPARGVQGWARGLPRAPRAHGLFVCPSVQTQ